METTVGDRAPVHRPFGQPRLLPWAWHSSKVWRAPELPSDCPQNPSRDGKKSCRNSKSTRLLNCLSVQELRRNPRALQSLQKPARLNPSLSASFFSYSLFPLYFYRFRGPRKAPLCQEFVIFAGISSLSPRKTPSERVRGLRGRTAGVVDGERGGLPRGCAVWG